MIVVCKIIFWPPILSVYSVIVVHGALESEKPLSNIGRNFNRAENICTAIATNKRGPTDWLSDGG